jgi:hypothetical protein
MLQGLFWLFDDPISDLLLAGIFVFAALHRRQMTLMRQRTDQLAFLISTVSFVPDAPAMPRSGPSRRFHGRYLPSHRRNVRARHLCLVFALPRAIRSRNQLLLFPVSSSPAKGRT